MRKLVKRIFLLCLSTRRLVSSSYPCLVISQLFKFFVDSSYTTSHVLHPTSAFILSSWCSCILAHASRCNVVIQRYFKKLLTHVLSILPCNISFSRFQMKQKLLKSLPTIVLRGASLNSDVCPGHRV